MQQQQRRGTKLLRCKTYVGFTAQWACVDSLSSKGFHVCEHNHIYLIELAHRHHLICWMFSDENVLLKGKPADFTHVIL